MNLGLALGCCASALVVLVASLLDGPNWSGVQGWHLPWPLLQWALTTLAGNLTLVGLGLLVIGPSFVLFGRWTSRREVAQAPDVTELPLAAWPGPRQVRFQPSPRPRWGEVGRREWMVRLILLVLSVLLAIALVGVVCTTVVALVKGPDFSILCTDQYRCPPIVSLVWMSYLSYLSAFALLCGTRSFWLRRVEATSGVWFRYAGVMKMTLGYVRQPEVTPGAAEAACRCAASARAVPLERQVCISLLMVILGVLPFCATVILLDWLPGQWLPG